MRATVNRNDLQYAIRTLNPYFSANNDWPFVFLDTTTGGIVVNGIGPNRSSFTACYISAQIEEEGQVCGIIGSVFSSLVNNTYEEDRLLLRSTENAIFIEDQHRFKARLQINGESPQGLLQVFTTIQENMARTVSLTTTKEDVYRLLRLSNAFNPHTASGQRWCVLKLVSGQCTGLIQETEMGAVESLPIETSAIEGEGEISFNTSLIESLLKSISHTLKIETGPKRSDQILLTDPDNPALWILLAQFKRPGEKIV